MIDDPSSDTILYGAAYYHEYMPEPRLETDLQWMREAAMSVIRVGESTWSDWEPRDGEFCCDWMREILDGAHAKGLKVILGFPTYSIPPWLHRLYPDIVVNRQLPGRDRIADNRMPTFPAMGPPGAYGPRQNQDYCHPQFLMHAARITSWILDAFAGHPAVIGYQLDNETAPNGCVTPHSAAKFRRYLQEKFETVEEVNRRFVLAFWGQKLGSWDDLPSPEGLINPGLRLEWDRFQRKTVTDYLGMLAQIVRQKRLPGQIITHDFVGGLLPMVDQAGIARELDVVAANIYYPTQDGMNAGPIWFAADVARSLKRKNFWITETNAQSIGWDSRTQHPHYPAQLRLATLAQVASGADLVSFWHWATLHNGQETYWRGVLGHDLEKGRTYDDVCEIGRLLARIGPVLAGQTVSARVAILYSADSSRALAAMPFHDDEGYESILGRIYGILHDLGVQVDFVFDAAGSLEGCDVLMVPPLYVASTAELEGLAAFVENGGHALVCFKSGFVDSNCTVRRTIAPGPLRRASGVYYREFTSLAEPVPLAAGESATLAGGTANVWADLLLPESAEVLAALDHAAFPHPVVTRNSHGRGTLTYQGTVLDDATQRRLIVDVLGLAGISAPESELPRGVKLRQTRTRDGLPVWYYLNFGADPRSVRHAGSDGVDMLTESDVPHGSLMSLGPWGAAVVRGKR
ncbi:MAG: beta-galactosidase [Verrucomicrobiia bacterium]